MRPITDRIDRPRHKAVLRNFSNTLEFALQPRNWLTLIVFIGMVSVLLNEGSETSRLFWVGWFFASFFAYIPALFCRSWDNRSHELVKADRSLAYCEGWRRCLASFSSFAESPRSEETDESRKKAIDSDFQRGIAYVEGGKHMCIY
jgi:hypothetical protein